jgi:hypothetical protein
MRESRVGSTLARGVLRAEPAEEERERSAAVAGREKREDDDAVAAMRRVDREERSMIFVDCSTVQRTAKT